jgi:hypothetical protein
MRNRGMQYGSHVKSDKQARNDGFSQSHMKLMEKFEDNLHKTMSVLNKYHEKVKRSVSPKLSAAEEDEEYGEKEESCEDRGDSSRREKAQKRGRQEWQQSAKVEDEQWDDSDDSDAFEERFQANQERKHRGQRQAEDEVEESEEKEDEEVSLDDGKAMELYKLRYGGVANGSSGKAPGQLPSIFSEGLRGQISRTNNSNDWRDELETKFRSLESKSKGEPNEVIKVGTVIKEQKNHNETYSKLQESVLEIQSLKLRIRGLEEELIKESSKGREKDFEISRLRSQLEEFRPTDKERKKSALPPNEHRVESEFRPAAGVTSIFPETSSLSAGVKEIYEMLYKSNMSLMNENKALLEKYKQVLGGPLKPAKAKQRGRPPLPEAQAGPSPPTKQRRAEGPTDESTVGSRSRSGQAQRRRKSQSGAEVEGVAAKGSVPAKKVSIRLQ